jgi:Flp pilus assembly protein TadG
MFERRVSGSFGRLAKWFRPIQRLRRDESGATVVEFAMVATPFFMLIFGIFGICIYQFTQFSLQNAVDQAARSIRTGAFATAGAQGGVMTSAEFKQAVCGLSPAYIDCANKLKVFVIAPGSTFSTASANRPSCNSADPAANPTPITGGRSTIILVVACYTFDLAATLPYLQLGNAQGQAAIIQASTVFKTEP